MSKPDGGDVFVRQSSSAYMGISLRDLFAAVALHAMATRGGGGIPEVPGEAYEYADKMLKERDK